MLIESAEPCYRCVTELESWPRLKKASNPDVGGHAECVNASDSVDFFCNVVSNSECH